MRQLSPHYRRGYYAGNKPYRACLVAALKHFGLTSFQKGEEFWSLGGAECHEFKFLIDNGLEFGTATYHNIDRGTINKNDDLRVTNHCDTEFLDIFELWSRPRVLCFDCTEQIVKCNENGWIGLVDLAVAGAKLSGNLCLNWNYMTGYGHLQSRVDGRAMTTDELIELYEWWLSILLSRVEFAGFKISIFDKGVMMPKDGSSTSMLCGHCLIST